MPNLKSSPLNANPNSPQPPVATNGPEQNESQLGPGGSTMIKRRSVGPPPMPGVPQAPPQIPPPALPPHLAQLFATLRRS